MAMQPSMRAIPSAIALAVADDLPAQAPAADAPTASPAMEPLMRMAGFLSQLGQFTVTLQSGRNRRGSRRRPPTGRRDSNIPEQERWAETNCVSSSKIKSLTNDGLSAHPDHGDRSASSGSFLA